MAAKKDKVKVRSFQMTFDSRHFNKNQRVWIQKMTGAMAAKVTGKFRGDGRYISAWVSWDTSGRDNPAIKEFPVDYMFAERQRIEFVTIN